MGENIEAIKIYYFNVILLNNFHFHSKKKKKTQNLYYINFVTNSFLGYSASSYSTCL